MQPRCEAIFVVEAQSLGLGLLFPRRLGPEAADHISCTGFSPRVRFRKGPGPEAAPGGLKTEEKAKIEQKKKKRLPLSRKPVRAA